ncbi:tripartite motif-containing protein 26-like isoform X2 [Mauremys mutica]|nr:tripartite motif-containing protein 26-like isoform X2 [Mauremys mutica]
MASGTPVREIQEETNCPICLEYLTDPVTIQCGHNFCRSCISQYCETWEEQDSDPLCCPSCRARIWKGAFQSNYQLANIVEKIKQMDFKRGKENLCERHGKALDLFCEEDGEAVCVVCERSSEHRSHMVLLIEEAAQKYKERIQAHLKTLREEREKLLGLKATGEGNCREYLKQTQTERQKIMSEFQQLQQFLEEQERLLLAQLEKLDKEIVWIQNENVSKLSEQISRLSELINEVEGKCQKPASEFLQHVRTTLSRYVAPSHSTMLGKSLMMRVAPHLPGALQQTVWGDHMLDTNLSDQLHPGVLTLVQKTLEFSSQWERLSSSILWRCHIPGGLAASGLWGWTMGLSLLGPWSLFSPGQQRSSVFPT